MTTATAWWRRLAEWAGRDDSEYSDERLHVSFLLFIMGGLLALAAVALVTAGQYYPWTHDMSMRYHLRQAGGVAGGLGGVLLFLGMLSALSTRRYMRWLGVGGAVVSLAGVGGFALAYPYYWGVGGRADWSVEVLGVLLAGFVLLLAATFAAVVSNLILRHRVRSTLRDKLGREPTEAEIQRDIDEAMRQHRFTWGGVHVDEGRGLKVHTEPWPEGWETVGWKVGRDVTTPDTTEIDASVRQLEAFRGGHYRTGELDVGNLDTNANALRSLREDLAAKEAAKPWNRFKAWLARLFNRIFHRGMTPGAP